MTPVVTAKPLAGRVVVVTRPRAQAQAFAGLLEAAGASVLLVPTIAIEAPASWQPLDRALERLRLAAIGPATAEALHALGLETEVVPEEYVAEGLAARLGELIRPGERVLLARAAEARDVLVIQLEAAGALVDEVPAYRTRPAAEDAGPLRRALALGKVDVVTFTSSSTVRHFAALFPGEDLSRLLRGVAVACIGPVTGATAREVGLEARIVPREYTIPALARAIADHYASRTSRPNDAT